MNIIANKNNIYTYAFTSSLVKMNADSCAEEGDQDENADIMMIVVNFIPILLRRLPLLQKWWCVVVMVKSYAIYRNLLFSQVQNFLYVLSFLSASRFVPFLCI